MVLAPRRLHAATSPRRASIVSSLAASKAFIPTSGWPVDLVERPPNPAPEEVLKLWAAEWAKEGEKVDWQRLMPPKGFHVLPRRGIRTPTEPG